MNTTDVRCPEHKFRLFGKIKVDKDTNWLEVKCRECTKEYNKNRMDNKHVEVFHCYDLAINRMETKIRYFEKKEEDTNGSSNNSS